MSPAGNPQGLSPELFSLFRYGLAAVLVVYLPYLGILVGGAAASVVLRFLGTERRDARSHRLSREVIGIRAFDPRVLYAAALLPVFPIAFLSQRILEGAGALPWHYWIAPLAALLPGCVLLSAYRSSSLRTPDMTDLHFRAGAAGVAAILAFAWLLFVLLGTLVNPTKLPLLLTNAVYILSWNSQAVFLLFLALSFGLTGGIVLIAHRGATADEEPPDPAYRDYARSVGSSLASGGAFAAPVPVAFGLLTLPSTALSPGVFAAAAVVLVLSLGVVLVLRGAKPGEDRAGVRASAAYVLMFFALAAGGGVSVGSAFVGRTGVSAQPSAGVPGETRVPEVPPAPEPAMETGRAVFMRACRACHLFATRIAGPPMDEVAPKYKGDIERLERYIRNPQPVDANYPPMPPLALGDKEIDAVARYLLAVAGGEKATEKAAAAPAEEKGKAVFDSICSACHRFDSRLVGPPFDEVVPKYAGNVDRLKGFIRNPVKKNPGYPSMPKLGLKEEEIDAVARYLISRAGH